jgi:hypothetical protein
MASNPYNGLANQVYGFEAGATSPRQSALLFGQNMDEQQNDINKTHGGSKYSRRLLKNRKRYSGGQVPPGQIEIPSFNPPGPQVSPFDANSASRQGNQAFIDTLASACNDCHVNNTCASTPGCPGSVSGGGRKKYLKNTPFTIEFDRVKISPFKNTKLVKNTLKKWKKNKKSIGFTFRSSLKSMGLIPRASGKYELGNKYVKLSLNSGKSKKRKYKSKKVRYTRKNRYN